MKEIVFVTSNKGKIATAQNTLPHLKIIAFDAELIEPRSDDIREIAKQKVIQAYKITNKPCIALDAGFFIDEWNGFPRAYVNPTLETLGVKGLLKLMHDVENRSCQFKQCLAYYDGETMNFFESQSPGHLSTSIRGNDKENKWSDLWYIFKPLDFDKTLAEFDDEDFESYRKLAEPSSIKKFGLWYDDILE